MSIRILIASHLEPWRVSTLKRAIESIDCQSNIFLSYSVHSDVRLSALDGLVKLLNDKNIKNSFHSSQKSQFEHISYLCDTYKFENSDYIFFLDDDDFYHPAKINEQIKFMKENNYSWCNCLMKSIKCNTEKVDFAGLCVEFHILKKFLSTNKDVLNNKLCDMIFRIFIEQNPHNYKGCVLNKKLYYYTKR